MADDDHSVVSIDDEVLDRRILALRLNGTSVYEIGRQVGKAVRWVTRSLERTLPALTPELRQRLFAEDLVRIDELLGTYFQRAKSGDIASANIVIKLLERRACMTGAQAATRIEITVPSAVEEGSSTAALLRELDRIHDERANGTLALVPPDPDPPAS